MEDDNSSSSSGSYRSPNSAQANADGSPATSPSCEGTHAGHKRKRSGSTICHDAEKFLSDLSSYLPLGCLCFEDFTEPGEDNCADAWQDVTQLPRLPAFDDTLYSYIQRLAAAGWIRVLSSRSSLDRRFLLFRIYILPFDVGLRYIDRQNRSLRHALERLVAEVDVSKDTWEGRFNPAERICKFDLFATADEGSLFWMFNKLPSPAPDVSLIEEKYAREGLEDLLDPASVLPGLRTSTSLHPYQRRSAGLMLQRESISTLQLDPRLERRTAPDGLSEFYYGPRDMVFLRHPRYYEACKGGVLAETMGLGKTVICLAVILATKHHPPKIPPQYSSAPVRSTVGTLASMAVSVIHRKSLPWKIELERIRHATGNDMSKVREALQDTPAAYDIPLEPIRWNRKTVFPPPKKMTLAASTVIVVPRNLCKQWQSEIRKHIDDDVFRLLVMEDSKISLPPPEELRSYDVILFTRSRFEMEIRDGSDSQGRRLGTTSRICECPYIGATRTRNCNCLRADDLYDSPLKHLHFKRLIIDEGHFFSNTNNAAVSVANKLITVDHRWVVSGTPAKDLLGVEVDMSSAENLWHTPDTKDSRDAVLEQRRRFSKKDDTHGAIKSLGALATNFLKIKPWAEGIGERRTDWDDYVYRHEELGGRRTFSSFSTCLRRTLEAMVIKTQPEDVERDIDLPPLSHEVVRLEPSFYDKLTANLFTIVLTANAVTSERTDQDFIFHSASRKARSNLVSNLRQSAFFWTGFSEADVLASLKSSRAYLEKKNTGCTLEDRKLLTQVLAFAETILASAGWKCLANSHELGLFVDDWPNESAEHWAFNDVHKPLLTGVSQLLEAQSHVNERASHPDPGEGLSGVGIKSLAPAKYGTARKDQPDEKQKAEKPIMTKAGIPISSIDGEPPKRRMSLQAGKTSPKKSPQLAKVIRPQKRRSRSKVAIKSENIDSEVSTPSVEPRAEPSREAREDLFVPQSSGSRPANAQEQGACLPDDSAFLRSRIIGSTSAKLSYLISQILKFYENEKIVVFYDGDNVAYYIAQVLELLHIKHNIYAKSLAARLKAEYVVRFDQDPQDRVLLMDVRNAAFGLNLPSASRIYFVNPVCRPNVEAQAIKRAHRIGQTRKVFVETLVLKGTIEEKMLERSRRMSRSEHREASHLEDDGGIRQIIQSSEIIPIAEYEKYPGYGQMAAIDTPQQLFGRPGWKSFTSEHAPNRASSSKKKKAAVQVQPAEDQSYINTDAGPPATKKIRRTLDYVDCTGGVDSEEKQVREDDSDDEPMLSVWRRTSWAATEPTSSARSFAMAKQEDPFLPQMAYTLGMHGGTIEPASPEVLRDIIRLL